jgi:hypothetical protein
MVYFHLKAMWMMLYMYNTYMMYMSYMRCPLPTYPSHSPIPPPQTIYGEKMVKDYFYFSFYC